MIHEHQRVMSNVRYPHRPHLLLVEPWLWLAAEADELQEKRRCPEVLLREALS